MAFLQSYSRQLALTGGPVDVELFRPRYEVEECLAEIRECLTVGWTGSGFKTSQFEEAWKSYTQLPQALFVNSATSGLHLAVKALKDRRGWREGDEVVSTPLTFVSTNHVLLYEGLKVRFADVDETLCLDPESVARAITPRTRAVMYVGMGGNSGHLDKIQSICNTNGLDLILDAAHLAGTRVSGEHVGAGASAVVFSFQAVKNLPTADSGMVCFAEAIDDEYARKLSWMGINKDTYARTHSKGSYKWMYEIESLGYKYHGNSIMAAIGLAQLRYLDRDNAYRRQLSCWYDEALSKSDHVVRVPIVSGCESSRHLYPVLVENRDEVILALNSAGIAPGVHYRINTDYPMYSYGTGDCPVAEHMSQHLLSLPMHLGLGFEDVKYVSHTLGSIIEGQVVRA